MTFYSPATIILALLLLIYSSGIEAEDSPQVNISELHHLCKKSPNECLPAINKKLRSVYYKSHIWYSLMQFKFDALFTLQDIKTLYENTKPWIDEDDLPVPFKVSLYIHYAKSLKFSAIGKPALKKERKKYIKKAEQQIALMHSAYPNPMLLILLANLKMHAEEVESAYQLLLPLEVKYRKYPDPELKLDLYGNLAHLADRLGHKKQAISYWITCLKGAIEFKNNQQIATAYYNLASSQVTNNDFTKAEGNYINAIEYSTLANDGAKLSQAQYYLYILMHQQGLMHRAKEVLQTMDISKFPKHMKKERELIQGLI